MEIRQAVKEDMKDVARVYIDSWRTTYNGLVPAEYLQSLSYIEAEQKWNGFLAHDNDAFIYAAVDHLDQVIGFAAGRRINDSDFDGELYALYLLDSCRGQGAGRKLIRAAAQQFRERSINSMLVWVMKQNTTAVRFYERLGGVEYASRTSMFGSMTVEDAAYGWKDIADLKLK